MAFASIRIYGNSGEYVPATIPIRRGETLREKIDLFFAFQDGFNQQKELTLLVDGFSEHAMPTHEEWDKALQRAHDLLIKKKKVGPKPGEITMIEPGTDLSRIHFPSPFLPILRAYTTKEGGDWIAWTPGKHEVQYGFFFAMAWEFMKSEIRVWDRVAFWRPGIFKWRMSGNTIHIWQGDDDGNQR